MSEELEVRYLVESVEGTYCVCGYVIDGDNLLFTEGDGVVHTVPIKNISKLVQEKVTRKDITNEIKHVALV